VLDWLDGSTMARLLPVPEAVAVIERALVAGLDPRADPPRTAVDVAAGQVLLMPSHSATDVGVKIVSIAPGNPERGRPRIQAVYVLLDAAGLTPVALLDGTALTALRTPAVSAVAARHLAEEDASRLVVFGTGPQALAHVAALRAVRPIADVVVVGRDPDRTTAFAERTGARIGGPDAVADADIVVCATTAADALFRAEDVRDTACVLAIGSHEPHRRELPAALLGRAGAVVEDVATALREAGDVIMAVAEGALEPDRLLALADVVTGRATVDRRRPRVFKSVGMAWQDLVVAAELHRRATTRDRLL
jgi:ornithine cyclodeaminase